jgi:hypothetical protein
MKHNSRQFGLKVFIMLLVLLSIACSASKSKSYYVDSLNGSDSNSGIQTIPFKTIRKAVNAIRNGDSVTVLTGEYPEFVVLKKSNISFTAIGSVSMMGFDIPGNNNRVSGFIISNPSSEFGIRTEGNDNLVENNDISNTKQDGIWFFGSGNKFIGNRIHDIVDRSKISTDPHVDCFQTWGPAENIIIEKNFCNHTSTYGSNQIIMLENILPPVRNIIVKNNVFIMHDPGYSPMNFYRKEGQDVISGIYVLNNTIIHADGPGQYGIWFRHVSDSYALNNIFIDYGYEERSYIFVDGGTNIQISNNGVYKSDKASPIGGMFPNDLWIENPGFVNSSIFDFHLLSTSALIDKGFDAISLVTDDFDSKSRPQGPRFDIGAFEYIYK